MPGILYLEGKDVQQNKHCSSCAATTSVQGAMDCQGAAVWYKRNFETVRKRTKQIKKSDCARSLAARAPVLRYCRFSSSFVCFFATDVGLFALHDGRGGLRSLRGGGFIIR